MKIRRLNNITGVVLVLFFGWVVMVHAGSSLLDQGSKALKSIGLTGEDAGTDSAAVSGLSLEDITAGLKEALKVGSGNVVQQLGAVDGFNKDAKVHIPLPDNLAMAKKVLDKAGFSSLTNDLELKLNRAAEAAAPEARSLFLTAITDMSFEDARAIYEGPDDSATQYFKGKMSPGLADAMKPVVDNALSEVKALQAYDAMIKEYKTLPFVPDVKSDLSGHVVEKGMAGIFYYMAEEEKAIRQDPVKRTTELLQKVFK